MKIRKNVNASELKGARFKNIKDYDCSVESAVTYPDGSEVDINSDDMYYALNHMYGEDRDMDIHSYTEDEMQRAIDYWLKYLDSADIGFNEWLLHEWGIGSDDMTDEDYDMAYDEYQNFIKDKRKQRSDFEKALMFPNHRSIRESEVICDQDVVDLEEYKYINDLDGYSIYRKVIEDENGIPRGKWAAQDIAGKYPPFVITYKQAKGEDVIDKHDSDIKKLSRELGKKLLPNSSSRCSGSQPVSSSYKRVARYGEFDNGHVFFDYDEMDDDTAEDKARQASLNDPNDIYYVKYDDVMNPDSDNRWYRGKKYHWSDITYRNGRYQPVESSEDPEFDEYEDDIKEIGQEFTSENTSINSTKLPVLFKLVSFEPGTVNIDYGGGKFDNVADYLSQYDVINLVYDPYNRSKEHNQEVIKTIKKHGGADTATCSNVLNVIKEPEVRKNVLENIKKLVKPAGTVYLTVYEGTGKGDEGPTKSGYQLNRKTSDYLEEIQEVFPDATRRGKLIIAHLSGSVSSSIESASYGGAYDIEDDMFFTKEEIVEFADDIADQFDLWAQAEPDYTSEFQLADVYIGDGNTLTVEVSNDEFIFDATVRIDMRKIQKPSDIYKYKDDILRKLKIDHVQHAHDYIESATISPLFDWDSINNPPEYDEPEELYDSAEFNLDFDTDVEIREDGSWEYINNYGDKVPLFENDDYRSEEFDVYVRDNNTLEEDSDDIIMPMLPSQPGTYHISGTAHMYYEVSHIYRYVEDEDDEYIDTEYADVRFDKKSSYISNFKIS